MKRKARYFIKTKAGEMLCRDGKLRDWVWLGTMPSSLKVYKSERWAIKAARKIVSHQDKNFITYATVMYAYDDEKIDSEGNITKRLWKTQADVGRFARHRIQDMWWRGRWMRVRVSSTNGTQ